MELNNIACRLRLSAHVRQLGQRPSLDEQVQLQERRHRLQTQIDSFSANASTLLNLEVDEDFLDSHAQMDRDDLFDHISESDTEVDVDNPLAVLQTGAAESTTAIEPERSSIMLPSTLGLDWCKMVIHTSIVQQEIGLRMGQANDALHQIRIALAQKSFLFRTSIRNAKSQQKKTRAWQTVHSVEVSVRQHARIYCNARQALIHLGAEQSVISKYQVLKKADLKASTAIIDVRIPSRSEATLSWFWNMDVKGDTENHSWMAERECRSILNHFLIFDDILSLITTTVYRVHWLRAKAKFDRAREQVTLLPYEMDWTILYFRTQVTRWSSRREKVGDDRLGHICYADRQIAMWRSFEEQATFDFSKLR